jgi:hypothetical protein
MAGLASPAVPAPVAGSGCASVRRPLHAMFRTGARVLTQDGFFAKIVGLNSSPDDDGTLLLALDVAGIGLREDVPAKLVTPSDRRSVPLSPRPRSGRALSPTPLSPRVPPANVRRERRGKARQDERLPSAGDARSPCVADSSGGDKAPSLDTSLEEETQRFKQTSEALDDILSENSRLQSSLEAERKALGSTLDTYTQSSGLQASEGQGVGVAGDSSPPKRPSVPILKLPGMPLQDAHNPRTQTAAPSPSMGCLSPRLASTMGEHRLHLQESASTAQTIGRAVGTISQGVSSWKEEIERDRKEQEEWRRNRMSSPRTPRAVSSPCAKKQITPKEPRDGSAYDRAVTETGLRADAMKKISPRGQHPREEVTTSHGPPGPRTPRSPRFLQARPDAAAATALKVDATWAAESSAECAPVLRRHGAQPDSSHQTSGLGSSGCGEPSNRNVELVAPHPRVVRQLEPSLSSAPHSPHLLASRIRPRCSPAMARASSLESAIRGSPLASSFRARCMSPGGDLTSRVRRCALANLMDKGRSSIAVIFCFDAWRMLMYCRVQHELGQEETMMKQLQHESDVALYQQQLQQVLRQQEEERELFQRRQNEERELFLQMIAMLSQTNAQLQSSVTELQQAHPQHKSAPGAGTDALPAQQPFPVLHPPVIAPRLFPSPHQDVAAAQMSAAASLPWDRAWRKQSASAAFPVWQALAGVGGDEVPASLAPSCHENGDDQVTFRGQPMSAHTAAELDGVVAGSGRR